MRRAIPTTIPLADPTADERHRSGMSCKTNAAYCYDANGKDRWCIDCHVKLGQDLDAQRLNWLLVVPIVAALAVLVVFFLIVNHGLSSSGTPVTPTTYGNPPVVHSMP